MGKTSIVIPARNEPYLEKTIDDIFTKAAGEIEIIVILDGWWPEQPLRDRDNLIIIHNGTPEGTKPAICSAVRIASGKYIMKSDAHCMFSEGFDEALKNDCEEGWLTVPRRYSLDPDKWEKKNDKFVDYLYLTYPYINDKQFGYGFHGRKWTGATKGEQGFYEPERLKGHILIDDIMAYQGSCWLMHKSKFEAVGGYNVSMSAIDNHFQEPNEMAFKVWLSGGRCIRNKNAWYAHWHKNKPSGYSFSKKAKYKIEDAMTEYWMNDKWPKAKFGINWLVEKFWPIPGWPEDWYERREVYKKKVSR